MKDRQHYKQALAELQVELVRYQQWAMAEGEKVVVVFEGRDGAGKDGTIKRITEHLAPRNTRVAALPKPSDRQSTEWFFQRYVRHLPAAGEIVIFNRSWYNRAGVDRVMDFATARQQEDFLHDAPTFERMLCEANIRIVKFWLDISKDEQERRLEARRNDPLKALKVSALDGVAQKKWKAYSQARNEMLIRTHSAHAPWTCVHTDKKKKARLAVIRHLLHALAPADIYEKVDPPDPKVLFTFEADAINDGRLEP
ncbi:polyphosphate kinase 2 [Phenylobacterium montanum]|uniref:ADP/GDP-polyphosphate phosphotransferase n=1 Tax=Phenylobacterium montanum TaxID=2823693 RepID=A0A975IUA8_9CAUL|nr:polyphosphate kinase 2 [Caulobacter sp. S6]QUD87329.1 polyphosphate kinase 2 [Caulobacter sp. S6]